MVISCFLTSEGCIREWRRSISQICRNFTFERNIVISKFPLEISSIPFKISSNGHWSSVHRKANVETLPVRHLRCAWIYFICFPSVHTILFSHSMSPRFFVVLSRNSVRRREIGGTIFRFVEKLLDFGHSQHTVRYVRTYHKIRQIGTAVFVSLNTLNVYLCECWRLYCVARKRIENGINSLCCMVVFV